MSETFQPGAELQAMELLQVDVDAIWDIEELIAYRESLKASILRLVSSVLDRRPDISQASIKNIDRIRQRVDARLAHVLDVIDRIREDAATDQHTVPDKAGAVHSPKL